VKSTRFRLLDGHAVPGRPVIMIEFPEQH